MLTCSKCNHEKPEAEFSKRADRPNGHQPYCKDCNRKESAKSNQRRRKTLEEAKRLLREGLETLEKLTL